VRVRRSNGFKVKMLKRLPSQGEAVEKGYLIVTVHWLTPLKRGANEIKFSDISSPYYLAVGPV